MSIDNQIEKAKSLRLDRKEEWVMERRQVELPIKELGPGVHPHMLLCITPRNALAIGASVVRPDAPESEVLSWALGCMISPMAGKPRRPKTVILAGGGLDHLRPVFEQIGVEVKVQAESHPAVNEIMSLMMSEIGMTGVPPYLSQKDLDPEVGADFFRAAADFYKLKPWKLFDYEVPMKVKICHKKPATYWAVIMGAGGMQFGLSLLLSGDEIQTLFGYADEDDTEMVAETVGMLGFSFENVKNIGDIAREEYQTHGWTLAAKSAYPSVIVHDPKAAESPRLPSRKELQDLIAVTRAVTEFCKTHRREIEQEDEEDGDIIEAAFTVPVAGQQIDVTVEFPAPEFLEEDIEDEDEDLSDIFGGPFRPAPTPLDEAQDLMYEAWEESSKAKRVKLARIALSISPDVADAYLLLAMDAAKDADEARKYLEQAVAAGERAIGKEAFKELKGHFWHAIETRPYMRARLALAHFRADHGEVDQAIRDMQEMLKLNPGDNQGVRYILVHLLLSADRDDEAGKLLKQFKGDSSAFWLYSEALLAYRKSGESQTANRALAKALAGNECVPEFLLGRKKLPKSLPGMYALGSKDEAVLYAYQAADVWKETEGALDWLGKSLG